MSKVISLEEVTSSKTYVYPSNNLFAFEHPLYYIQPFLDMVSPFAESLIFEADNVVVNTNEDKSNNTSYGRLSVKAKLQNDYDFEVNGEHFTSEMGMVYAFDTKKPEIKLFSGKRVSVCTNQCIFGADNITSILLTNNKRSNINEIARLYFDKIKQDNEKYIEVVSKMMDTKILDFDHHVGRLVNKSIKMKNLGIRPVLAAVGLLNDETSKYEMVKNDANRNLWVSYNALTEVLKKENIFEEASKTLLLENLYL